MPKSRLPAFSVALALLFWFVASTPTLAVTIKMMAWEQDPITEGIELFQELNPDIKVEFIHVPYDEYVDSYVTRRLAGVGVDVLWVEPSDYLNFVNRGWLMDVTNLIEQDAVLGDPDYFMPAEALRSEVNGRWYGIGAGWNVTELYYDTNIFQEAGLPPAPTRASDAWTWNEYLQAAQRATRRGPDGIERWGSSFPINYVNAIWSLTESNGGPLYSVDPNVWTIDSPEVVSTLEAIQEGFQRELLRGDWVGAITGGRIAMAIEGSFAMAVGFPEGYKPGVGVLPRFDAPKTVSWGTMHVIDADTAEPEAAWRLLKFLSSEAYQRILMSSGVRPGITSLMEGSILAEYDRGNMPEGYFLNSTQYLFDAGFTEAYPAGTGNAINLFVERAKEIWSGAKSARQVVDETLPLLNEVLREAQQD